MSEVNWVYLWCSEHWKIALWTTQQQCLSVQCTRFNSQTRHDHCRADHYVQWSSTISFLSIILLFVLDLHVSFLCETIADIIAHNKCCFCHYSTFNLPCSCLLLSNCLWHITIEGEINSSFMLLHFVANCCSLLLISLTNKMGKRW